MQFRGSDVSVFGILDFGAIAVAIEMDSECVVVAFVEYGIVAVAIVGVAKVDPFCCCHGRSKQGSWTKPAEGSAWNSLARKCSREKANL